jgi:tetratricopeptide (TPR) repeat protein
MEQVPNKTAGLANKIAYIFMFLVLGALVLLVLSMAEALKKIDGSMASLGNEMRQTEELLRTDSLLQSLKAVEDNSRRFNDELTNHLRSMAQQAEELSGAIERNQLAADELSQKGLASTLADLRGSLGTLAGKVEAISHLIGQISDKQARSQGDEIERAKILAKQLTDSGNLNDATFYFANALGKDPGNLELIEGYSDLIRKIAESHIRAKRVSEAADQLNLLESFIRARIPLVESQNVQTLLNVLSEVDKQKSSALASLRKSDGETNEEPAVDKLSLKIIKDLKERKLDLSIPKETVEIHKKITELEGAVDYPSPPQQSDLALTDSDIKTLQETISRLKVADAAGQLIDEARSWINLSDKEQDTTTAAYYLQLCENSVRQLLTVRDRLEPFHQKEQEELLKSLRTASENVSWRNSVEILDKFYKSKYSQFVESQSKVMPWGTAKAPDGECQREINKLTEVLGEFGKVLPKISDEKVLEGAREKLPGIGKRLDYLKTEQQRRYCLWALDLIKATSGEAERHIGTVTDDKDDIAKTMVKHMKEIDQRFLTFEVGRSYGDVFERLYGKLKNDNLKFRVVGSIMNAKKKTPSDF